MKNERCVTEAITRRRSVRNVPGKLGTTFFIILLSFLIFTSCEGIDCTLYNVVTLNIGFYNSESDEQVVVTDTLSITAQGTDSVLLNRGVRLQTLTLPMSYTQEADTLQFIFRGGEEDDTYQYGFVLRIQKTNLPHFESPDCPTTTFHEIIGAEYDDPYNLVDSIIVENAIVNYAKQENIKIYFRGGTD